MARSRRLARNLCRGNWCEPFVFAAPKTKRELEVELRRLTSAVAERGHSGFLGRERWDALLRRLVFCGDDSLFPNLAAAACHSNPKDSTQTLKTPAAQTRMQVKHLLSGAAATPGGATSGTDALGALLGQLTGGAGGSVANKGLIQGRTSDPKFVRTSAVSQPRY